MFSGSYLNYDASMTKTKINKNSNNVIHSRQFQQFNQRPNNFYIDRIQTVSTTEGNRFNQNSKLDEYKQYDNERVNQIDNTQRSNTVVFTDNTAKITESNRFKNTKITYSFSQYLADKKRFTQKS